MQEKGDENGIGERLRLVVRSRNMSIREFTRAADIEYRSFQDYLSGKRKPGAEQLIKLAAMDVDLEWLLTGAGRNGVYFHIHEPAGVSGLLASNSMLLSYVLQRCVSIVDLAHKRHISEGKEVLNTETLVLSAWMILKSISSVVDRDQEKLLEYISKGFAIEDVLNSLIGNIGESFVERSVLRVPTSPSDPQS